MRELADLRRTNVAVAEPKPGVPSADRQHDPLQQTWR
jgi:hypothetical protein